MLAAEPYPGAVETVRAWHEAGHFIHITSHRATDCHAVDRALAATGSACPTTSSTAPSTRSRAAREIGIDLLIDDSPGNLERALEAGMRAATLLHPWNRELCETEDVDLRARTGPSSRAPGAVLA